MRSSTKLDVNYVLHSHERRTTAIDNKCKQVSQLPLTDPMTQWLSAC